jgi:hypothetical protein
MGDQSVTRPVHAQESTTQKDEIIHTLSRTRTHDDSLQALKATGTCLLEVMQ